MPFCVHPVRVSPDHLAGRTADGKPDHGAVAGDPSSQMVCQVLRFPFLSLMLIFQRDHRLFPPQMPSWPEPSGNREGERGKGRFRQSDTLR